MQLYKKVEPNQAKKRNKVIIYEKNISYIIVNYRSISNGIMSKSRKNETHPDSVR